MRKTFKMIISVLLGAALLTGAGCGGGEPSEPSDPSVESHRHEVSKWEVIDEATCTQEGKRRGVCDQCKETVEETIPMRAHTTGEYFADEHLHWKECSVCNQKIGESFHIWVDGVCSVCLYSKDGTQGLNYRLNSDKRSYSLVGATSVPAQVAIPETYLRLPVTGIAENAFKGQTELESISLPASLTTIGNGAFDGCDSLASVTVAEENLNFASQNGILYDKQMTKFVCVPMAVAGKIYLPASITELKSGVLSGHARFTGLELHNGFTAFGEGALKDCAALEELVVPESVTSIGQGAFEGCVSLARLTLPDTWQDDVKKPAPNSSGLYEGNSFIGYLFGTASYMDNANRVPLSLKKVEFTGGTELTQYLFYGCRGIEEVVLPNTLEKIEANVFSGCAALKEIYLPDGVVGLETSAFSGCSSLKAIDVSPMNPKFSSQNGVLYNRAKTKTILAVPAALEGEISIPSGVARIPANAFQGCKITKVTLPETLLHIESNAFSNCTELETVEIPEASSLVSFGEYAFLQCVKLRSITVPASLMTIGLAAFGGCTALQAVYFKDPENWQRSFATDASDPLPADPSRLRDPAVAASELTGEFTSYYWSKLE